MKVNCAYDKLVPIHEIIPNPKNTNKHPDAQIRLLAKILDYQGVRHPIIVSNRSGFVVAGEGRYLAAKKNKWEEFPVNFQDFDNEAQEYAFLESDNHIAELAEHDREQMILNIKEMKIDVDLDLDLLGIPDLFIDQPNLGIDDFEEEEKEKKKKIEKCPNCGIIL